MSGSVGFEKLLMHVARTLSVHSNPVILVLEPRQAKSSNQAQLNPFRFDSSYIYFKGSFVNSYSLERCQIFRFALAASHNLRGAYKGVALQRFFPAVFMCLFFQSAHRCICGNVSVNHSRLQFTAVFMQYASAVG